MVYSEDRNEEATSDEETEAESQTEEAPETIEIKLPQHFRRNAILVLLLQLAVFIFLVVARCIPISIRKPGYGVLEAKYQFLYSLGVGIASVLVSMPAATTLRMVYLKKVQAQESSKPLLRQATTVVGLSSLRNMLRYWYISGTFLIVSLISAGIILAVTPSLFPLEYPGLTYFFPEHVIQLDDYAVDRCFTDGGAGSVDGLVWKLSSGKLLGVNTTGSCELQRVLPFLAQSNAFTLDDPDLAYSMGGVPVNKSAMGVPFEVPYEAFVGAFGLHTLGEPVGFWSELESVSICLPILETKPVSCFKTGSLFLSGRNLTVSSNGCVASTMFYSVDPSSQGATVAGICANDQEGTSTIVFGSIGAHATELSDFAGFAGQTQNDTFALTCSIDLRSSIAIRRLKLARYSRKYLDKINYNFQFAVTRDRFNDLPCKGNMSLDSMSTSTALAVGASAPWQLLRERSHLDGHLDTLLATTVNWNDTVSRVSKLEAGLWVAVAIGIGMYWASGQENDGEKVVSMGEYMLEGLRIGPSKWWGLVYTFLLLFSILVLAFLLWQTRSRS
ncbi:hypothetical protein H634G_08918 [Metarhizium anisopliae BRIP 53293]|uniref:Uncharacterized protein n=1 Tax=Metarhizium anisopliae BRIP 53293 TaxID=1291518 RepID=A0A0D9NNP9_METAN|nr:hypothetical protein H634G_08918 [Metarhizium anisopliae BRIP 53293]KJK92770.1 hypothetical protein H633G_03327 [Metarhizium anisopliae BRIP 53284]